MLGRGVFLADDEAKCVVAIVYELTYKSNTISLTPGLLKPCTFAASFIPQYRYNFNLYNMLF